MWPPLDPEGAEVDSGQGRAGQQSRGPVNVEQKPSADRAAARVQVKTNGQAHAAEGYALLCTLS